MPDREHGYHLYVVRVRRDRVRVDRDRVMRALRAEGIGCNLHYRPVYLHPYYAKLGYSPGACPTAERVADEIMTLPLFPRMSDQDADDVIESVRKIAEAYGTLGP